MATMLLSKTEQAFILKGIEENCRCDGRLNDDYRPIELETDVVSHASGSARLRLANTDILVGVKTEIDEPILEKPDQGKIEFFVDCSANATPEFEGRGGEELASSITNTMQRAYRSPQAFDLRQLCILKGKQCWKLYIDILILECGGNLCDAVSLAVKAALFNTKIPVVTVALMDGGNVDLQLSDDPYDCKYLEMGSAPLVVTLWKLGESYIVDPSIEEESCSIISLLVGVIGDPSFYSQSKTDSENTHCSKCSTIAINGCGSITTTAMKGAISQGIEAARTLDEALGYALLREKQKQKKVFTKDPCGFLK